MAVKLMFVPIDERQNYPLCRWKLLGEKFG